MRTLIVAEFISLDGVIQGPGGPEEDSGDGFRFGGWVVPYADEITGRDVEDLHSRPFELLLGRRTYDIWAAYWPFVAEDSPSNAIAEVFNRVPKHVATHKPATLSWQNSHALEGALGTAVAELKQRSGANLLVWGSGDMVHQLLAAGLVDELRLQIHPVVLGRGKRLFDDKAEASAFNLVHSSSTTGGVLITRYVRTGEVQTGTFDEVDVPEET